MNFVLPLMRSNASSMPSRLPLLSRILKTMNESNLFQDTDICMVAPSYRGYYSIRLFGLTAQLLDFNRPPDAGRS
jgi:hypothetical protein